MHIVYVGYPGFPLGHAQVERQKLIAKGLIACGCDVTVICRYGPYEEHDASQIPASGVYEGIHYIYTSGTTGRAKNFFTRNFRKAKGLINEFYLLYKYRSHRNLDAVIITTNSFHNVLLYSLVSFICRVPSILDNVEFFSSHAVKNSWMRLDYYLYDKYAYKMVDKVICISDFLLNIVKRGSPHKPVIKVPAIVDFSKFQHSNTIKEAYFLFCGSGAYFEVIDFIITAYEKLNQRSYNLYIVSSGSSQQVAQVKKRIEQSPQQHSIKFFTGLSYEELTQLYTSSRALLIPLLNREQDIARFPHKIGEYCASKRAIITTNIGEIPLYFTDMQNALIAEKPEPKHFADKMQLIIDNPHLTEQIGQRSFTVGQKTFEYKILGEKVFSFLHQPQNNSEPVTYSVATLK